MSAIYPYLALALATIVALWAFKTARALHQDANLLMYSIRNAKAHHEVQTVRDELAELADACERNREVLAKIQGRAGQKKWKEKAADISDPAAIKRELRKKLLGAKGNGESQSWE